MTVPHTNPRTRAGKWIACAARALLGCVAVVLATGARADRGEATLEALGARLSLDGEAITVSGISSGAYMAQQFHMAHSAHVAGAGLIAGGPYACATGSYPPYTWFDVTGLYAATSRCSNTNPWWFFDGPPDLETSLEATRGAAAAGGIDDPRNLHDDRVWLLSGSADETVPREVVDVLADYYREFLDPGGLRYEKLDGAGHAMVTDDFGNACSESRTPFISDCDYDAAGALLAHLYGPLHAPAPADGSRRLTAFDQRPFFSQDDDSVSLGRTGHVYVPAACRQGTVCRLHVVFHGCQQYAGLIGDAFYARAGYNEWAESNALVVLYPQTRAWSGSLFGAGQNPKGCWDWWGYSGADFHLRTGRQLSAVARMINALLGVAVLQTAVPGR